ncbi:MAG: UDP-N-acetylmuramoyl-L-alanyl-D-glutamate--2,6-diaminopimelate ligase [Nocardioides sp.]|nr:UDP-N-acetylmuramoyl-L-alanyl-D-glutamate--2,6-diaminopimelate ligase [Nocardioides sp.]
MAPPNRLPTRPERPTPVPLSTLLDGAPDVAVTGVTLSSQRVQPGDLYAALPGSRAHGADYAGDAVAAGAVAVLTDAAGAERAGRAGTAGVPVVVVDDPRTLLGGLAAAVYGRPAESMATIGVTGTQGKTTTTRLAEDALERAGVRASVIGTIGTRVAGRDVATSLTTPEAPDLHGLFALMREQEVEACVMEVSSHALVMGRVDGVVFDVAVFLNLGRDHLDFHDTVEDYYRAKATLFTPEHARRAVVNADDEHGRRLAGEVRDLGLPVRTFSCAPGSDADWRAEDVVTAPDGSTFTVVGPDGVRVPASVALPGDYNVANALAAVAAAAEAGIDPAVVASGLGRAGGVPGRLERVDAGQDFLVVVDYAHKPDAVEAALSALRPLAVGPSATGGGRVLTVLGAGGDRDPGKRPIMAEVAVRLSDVLVVTDDNPRSEDPATIRAAMLAGVPDATACDVVEVGDRRAAIAHALDLAGPGDVVLVAGKGHETGQEVDGVKHPFDDRDVVRELLTDRVEAAR